MTNSLRILHTLPPLETMVCFEAVARCGSFTRAAHELFITQSAVSKQIKALEDALGCALFDRHARGIRKPVTTLSPALAIAGSVNAADFNVATALANAPLRR